MNTEGMFANSLGALIDTAIKKERTRAVINHETVHAELGIKTSYGQLLMMLHKNAMFEERAKAVYEELFIHIRRMQERAAVNIELLTCYISDGEEAYRNAIEELKEKNRTYYNYFRKLWCINGRVKSQSDARDAVDKIMAISHWAMAIDLDNIPFERFFSAKDIQRFFSEGDNSSKYNPNSRFDSIVNVMYRKKGQEADLIPVLRGTVSIKDINDITKMHTSAERAAIKVFSMSPIKERLISRIQTIGVQQIAMNREDSDLLAIYPTNLNKTPVTVKLVDLDFASFQNKLSEQTRKEIMVPHQIGGFEDLFLICMWDDTSKDTICGFATNNEYDFLLALQKLNCRTLFFRTKLVNRLHKSLKRVIGQLPIFIYYDSAIIGALEFIKNFYRGGKYYFQEKQGQLLLVIYKKSFYAIFSIINEAKECMEEILRDDHIVPSDQQEYLEQVEYIHEHMNSGLYDNLVWGGQ